ncbi:MAG TPA: peroxiredoxin [Candidatus Omnitrophica bacterium]|nr:peroxiredoxin [Candidatus Omnitrophota bacterium]
MEEIKILKVGEEVPDFEIDVYLPEKKDFGRIRLSEVYRSGKWVILFFYPADFTFVCPTELADIADKYQIFREEGVEIISVSTDTQYVHLAWQKEEKLLSNIKFPMGADHSQTISKTFGIYDEETGLALRGTFIIDPDGKLVASEVNYYSVGRNSEELLRKFKAFKYVRENPAEVCPAKWEPGEKTLTPGKDIVGRVGEELDEE